jgi:hypothetical protein
MIKASVQKYVFKNAVNLETFQKDKIATFYVFKFSVSHPLDIKPECINANVASVFQ